MRGETITTGTATTVDAATKRVNDTAGAFTDVTVNRSLFVDLVHEKAALITAKGATHVILDEWLGTLATNRYKIITLPVLPKHAVSIEHNSGQSLFFFEDADNIARENRVSRSTYTWLMNSGGAGANNSQAFYIPPGVDKVTIELPFTHNADISVQRYQGDWLSLDGTEAELVPTATTSWVRFPAQAALRLAVNAVVVGSYCMEGMFDATPAITETCIHPGWYRLNSVAAAADKVFTVCYEIP